MSNELSNPIGRVKISQLPLEFNPENSAIPVEKGGQTKQIKTDTLIKYIQENINEGLVNTIVPELEVVISGNTLSYKIKNLTSEMLEQIGDSVKVGIMRYKQFHRRVDSGNGYYSISGRKWTLVDDSTSEYITKFIGDDVTDLNNRIFWTDVRIEPESLNKNAFSSFQQFGLTAENITSRYMYFVTGNGTSNMRLSSRSVAASKSVSEAQGMLRVTGKNSKVDFVHFGRMFYSLNIGLAAYRDVKIEGKTKRVFGNIVPFRVCLYWKVGANNSVEYFSNFRKLKK